MLTIKTWRDPYDAGFSICKPTNVTFNPGLTVLVGCNGSGKTTLLNNISEVAKQQKIPCHLYNNLHDGGQHAIGELLSGFGDDDIAAGIELMSASEGESIRLNIERQKALYTDFLKNGVINDRRHKIAAIFGTKEEKSICNQRVLLFDAVDSGLSIDMVCDLKTLYHSIIKYAEQNGIELYIIIAANEYELCHQEQCFNVNTGKYLTFTDYDDYRAYILKSHQEKVKRYQQQIAWEEKKIALEKKKYEIKKASAIKKADAIIEKNKNKNDYMCKWNVEQVFRELCNFARNCRGMELEKDAQKTKDEYIEKHFPKNTNS